MEYWSIGQEYITPALYYSNAATARKSFTAFPWRAAALFQHSTRFRALKRLGSSERQEFVFPYGFGWLETCSAVNF